MKNLLSPWGEVGWGTNPQSEIGGNYVRNMCDRIMQGNDQHCGN